MLLVLVVDAGADVNKSNNDGWTPLYIASADCHVDVVRALIDAGADVNKSNNDGWTPLQMASEYGYADVVRALIDAGADVNKQTNQKSTPLFLASFKNVHKGVILMLLLNGAFIESSLMNQPMMYNMFLRQSDQTDTDTVFIH